MKFTIDKEKLSNILNYIQSATKKSAAGMNNGLLMEVLSNKVKFKAFNQSIGIITEIDVKDSEDGSVYMDASSLRSLVNSLKGDVVEISTNSFDSDNICVKGARGEFFFNSFDIETFIDLPNVREDKFFMINAHVLLSMIKQVKFSASTSSDPDKAIYTGVLFNLEEDILSLVAIDGFRLAIRKEKIEEKSEDFKFVVPKENLEEIIKALSACEEDKNVKLGIDASYITFTINDFTFYSRLLVGDFLNYNANIPKEHSMDVVVNIEEFKSAIQTIGTVVEDVRKEAVRFLFEDDKIIVSCVSSTKSGKQIVDAAIKGDVLEIGFNKDYLLDVFKNLNVEDVKLELGNDVSPMVIKPLKNSEEDEILENFIYLILPVRLR